MGYLQNHLQCLSPASKPEPVRPTAQRMGKPHYEEHTGITEKFAVFDRSDPSILRKEILITNHGGRENVAGVIILGNCDLVGTGGFLEIRLLSPLGSNESEHLKLRASLPGRGGPYAFDKGGSIGMLSAYHPNEKEPLRFIEQEMRANKWEYVIFHGRISDGPGRIREAKRMLEVLRDDGILGEETADLCLQAISRLATQEVGRQYDLNGNRGVLQR